MEFFPKSEEVSMRAQVAYQHVDHSPALDQWLSQRFEKLESVLEGPAKWFVSKNGDLFNAAVKFRSFGKEFYLHGEGRNAFEAVSKAYHRAAQKLSKYRSQKKRSVHGRVDLSANF
jgi:ribosome-associated translation inhibitor RaiA